MQAAEPPKHLKGDAKVSLAAGQTKQVTVVLDRLAFSYWNAARGWTVAPGSYRVMIGSSACAIRKMGSVTER
jgi:beta-glucosidase